ncbi:MAG: MFS transporter [Gammaproteobacteria bacterium]|nr:MFS transporter [Gammaproteobacteria bacterium]|tara:strand:- start:1407 stop:2582 length:1176 start_codon:yes stop_codon:yes gene_type:complete
MTQVNLEKKIMNAIERRSIAVIAIISMLRMFGIFALLPVLSLYASELEDATPILVGLAVGAYGLTQASLQIPLGVLSDRIGRIPVIILGLTIFSIGSLLAAISDSIYGVIFGRLLQGAGAISATLSALITDTTRKEVRTKSMAGVGIGIGMSFMIAMILGPLIAANFGVRLLFLVAAIMAIIAGFALALLPSIPKVKKNKNWSLMPAMRANLLRIDAFAFLLHAIMTATFVALPFLLKTSLELDLIDHWKIYVGALSISLFISIPMIMNDHRQGRDQLILISISMIFIAQLAFTFFNSSLTSVFLALAVYFGGFNYLEASLPARLSIMSDDKARGASLGMFSSAQFLGAFIGGLIGGYALNQDLPSDVFLVCAFLASLWLIIQGCVFLRKT